MWLGQVFLIHTKVSKQFYIVCFQKLLSDRLSGKLEGFTGQIWNLPEISGSPASFAISVFAKTTALFIYSYKTNSLFSMCLWKLHLIRPSDLNSQKYTHTQHRKIWGCMTYARKTKTLVYIRFLFAVCFMRDL